MKILFYFGHPSQYLFLRNTISGLRLKGHEIILVIKSKDILQNLLENDGEQFINILTKKRKNNYFSIIWALFKRNGRIFSIIKKYRINLLVGTDASIAQMGYLLRIPCITVLEDDYNVISKLAWLTYPFTSQIITPEVCEVSKWYHKKIGYSGYMKLGYLHPNVFKANKEQIEKKGIDSNYVLIRLTSLFAHHDIGIGGLEEELLNKIIPFLEEKEFRVLISSETDLPEGLSSYQLQTSPSTIHHFLAFASLLISDSQSMSVEAAMLGTPSIRFSDFAGRISVLEELEHKYGLTIGIKPSEPDKLINKIHELLAKPNLNGIFQERRKKMLSEKIDVSAFMTWFIDKYPESIKIMKENPDYQYNFK